MRVFLLLKYLYKDFLSNLSGIYRVSRLQAKNPTCKIYSSAKISNSTFGNHCVLFENVIVINSSIGNHSYVQRNTRIVNTNAGKFCSIAADVSIGPGLHKTDGVSTHPSFYLKNTPLVKTFTSKDLFTPGKITEIGSDVWIGEKAIIVDGVKIGNGAIIAAGSVVTKNVADYSVVGGVPAKHIKFRFEPNVINELLDSRWWEQSDEWLAENCNRMNDLALFLQR